MTAFLLIRHAHCAPVGHAISGRTVGVHLSTQGRLEAEELAGRLSLLAISAIYSSPLERALETAGPLASRLAVPVQEAPGLLEVDFGQWTGKTLDQLQGDPEWITFNTFRSGARIPGGESTGEVLARALNAVEQIGKAHAGDQLVALVSHGDVLRTLLTYYLGMPLDLLFRLEISPASVSVIRIQEHGPEVLSVNSSGVLPLPVASRWKR
jgi:probable phosphomutase (TIGR03848 family)